MFLKITWPWHLPALYFLVWNLLPITRNKISINIIVRKYFSWYQSLNYFAWFWISQRLFFIKHHEYQWTYLREAKNGWVQYYYCIVSQIKSVLSCRIRRKKRNRSEQEGNPYANWAIRFYEYSIRTLLGDITHNWRTVSLLVLAGFNIIILTILGTDGTNNMRFQFVFAIVITILVAASLILSTLAYIKALDSSDCIKKEEFRNMLKLEGGLANNKTSMIPTGTGLSLKKNLDGRWDIIFYQATFVPVTDRQAEIPICSHGTASNEKIPKWPSRVIHIYGWYFQYTQTQYSLQRSINTSSLSPVMK